MSTIQLASIVVLIATTAYAKPMTGSVESWEGRFTLKGDKIPLQIEGKPTLLLWLYQLEKEKKAKGICVGFSTENGDMILAPKPNENGTQPVYTGHIVLFGATGNVEIIVTYDVQGIGEQKRVEKYVYDGKVIKLTSQSHFIGKRRPIWKPVVSVPPADGVTLVKKLGPKDSIARLRIDSQKSAKVTIYRCTMEKTVHGPALPAKITMSFLHFPDCRRMDVGNHYLCVVRQNSGDDYELVRSDMLASAKKDAMYNCFWQGGSEAAKKVVAGASKK